MLGKCSIPVLSMEVISLISWNVNGLVGDERFAQLLILLELLGFPDFVCLQEIHSNSNALILKWEKALDNYKCYFGRGDGRNKGTAILVKKTTPFYQSINGLVQDLDGRYTILKGKLGERLVTIASVYAPVDKNERQNFLGRFMGNNLEGILYIMGDFNAAVSRIMDRTYSNSRKDEDMELLNFMQMSDTVDVWRNLHDGEVEYSYVHPVASSRIDLCLVSSEIKDEFSGAVYIPNFSDHKLLKVNTRLGSKLIGGDFVKIKPHVIQDEMFKDTFEDFWWEQKRVFYNTITSKIKNGSFIGDMREAVDKIRNEELGQEFFLRNLKLDNRWWDKFKSRVFLCGKIVGKRIGKSKNQEYNSCLKEYYKKEEGTREKQELGAKLKKIVYSINEENLFKAQISDRLYFEKCSAPFFSSIEQRRKSLFIDKITKKDGRVLDKKKDIEEHLVSCFEELYSLKENDRTKYREFLEDLPSVQEDIGQVFNENFETFEVEEAISKAKSGRCPGLDGIPIEFYKTFSKLMVPFITKLFNNCMGSGQFPESWKRSVIKLIPKNEDLDYSFNNLRALTMGNNDKKLYARVWYTRLVKMSKNIINERQTGGMPGRSIQGSTLLIHLLITYYYEKGLEGYVLGLDDQKAFDLLIRNFLWDVMEAFGYSDFTIKNIKALYKDTEAVICINGFFTRSFKVQSGVLQGCPLSGLLYVISGEPLARAINRSIQISGFRLPSQQEIKMVQHVDDKTLMLSNQSSIIHVLDMVERYGKISGCVINRLKSFILKLGQSRNVWENNRTVFNGIKIVSENENNGCKKVLGFLFSAVPEVSIDKTWYAVTQKCQGIMDNWKDCNLSLVGRILVVNSLVIPKLVYILQTMNITKRRLGFLNKRISNFIFTGMGSKLKLNILEWGKERGGLGLVPVDLKGRALRFKTVKDYLGKSEGGREGDPVVQILAYFMDMTVRNSIYRDLPHLRQAFQDPVTGGNGILSVRNHQEHILKYYLEDVKKYKEFEVKYNNHDISKWENVFYLKKLIAERTGNEQSVMRTGRNDEKTFFMRQNLGESKEKKVCANIFFKGLDTKVQAFNYKMVNNLLPLYNIIGERGEKYCRYCRKKSGLNNLETMEHVFIGCIVASMVWGRINLKLHRRGIVGIDLGVDTIIYKLGMPGELVLLVSEVNWALWKNRNNNNAVIGNNVGGAKVVREMFSKRIKKLLRVDRKILKANKFKERWGEMDKIIGD